MRGEYELSVFINCPFDAAYQRLFRAIVFTVHDCGYIARSALELTDASQVRVHKILQIISECRVGIHDISRTELDRRSKLPRFNMPLELGMFLGAKRYGDQRQRRKICLVLDRTSHRAPVSEVLLRYRGTGHQYSRPQRREGDKRRARLPA